MKFRFSLLLFLIFSSGATVSAFAAPVSAVHFFAFGDWGSGNADEKSVATETKILCAKSRCDFGLLLGDNFYPAGVKSVDDRKWQTHYRSFFAGLQIPLLAALGNHDWKGNPQAEIDFTKKDPYWKMPAAQYTIRYPSTATPLLEVFVIDSDKFDETAEAWLKQAVALSKATWKILAFHHPLLNNGTEHPSDEMKLWPKLKPIVCGKIDLFLPGHEHIFSHLQGSRDGCAIEQVIIGTGGKELYSVRPIDPAGIKVLHSEAKFGLGYFEVTPNEMTLHFDHTDGTEAYRTTWKKP